MKQQRNIVLALFIAAALFSAMSGNAQTDSLISDETNVTVLKTTYKVVSTNYFVPDSLIKEFGDNLQSYTVKNKKDRHGKYKEYIIYFPIDMRQAVDYYILGLKRPETK